MNIRQVYLYPCIFYRLYTLNDGEIVMPVYITSRQVFAVLEGDSAKVCSLLFADTTGKQAFNYIVQNGVFEDMDNKEGEAIGIYNSFLDELECSGILTTIEADVSKELNPEYTFSNESLSSMYESASNQELEFAQIMADNHILYSMTLELTYECNERCIHCYCPSERVTKEMTIETISSLIDEFIRLGGFRLYITGGEVFARKDIVELLNVIKSKKIVVDIASNLTLLESNPEFIAAVKELRPRSIGVSVYSADADKHDTVTAVKGSFTKTIRAIKLLRAAQIPIVTKTPLMNITIDGWREVKALAIELGCEYQFDLGITAGNDNRLDPTELRVKSPEQVADLFNNEFGHLYNKEEKAMLNDSISEDLPICGAGANGLNISPDGLIRPCIGIMQELGKYPADSLEQIWHHSDFFAEWDKQKWLNIHECSTCKMRRFCFKCPGAWYVETGSYNKPSAYTCYLANILKDCITN
jgi:radical SAM protein with 4Fe4S-binding SPASM domain